MLALLALFFLLIPLSALISRVPFDLNVFLDNWSAISLSLITSSISAIFCLVLGLPLALVLARVEFVGRGFVRAITTMPIVLPPVVSGMALLLAFGRRGVFGRFLDLDIAFSTAAVVMAQTFVALPFLVLSVEGALRTLGRKLEESAATLGASPSAILRRITLPGILPAIISGTVLAWSRALGEFGATIVFAGNLPGRTQTLPVAIFIELQSDPQNAFVLGGVMIGIALVVILFLRGRWLSR